VSPDDAAKLRGEVARLLGTYADHPVLLLLRAITELLSRDCDSERAIDDLDAFLGPSRMQYGLDDDSVAMALGEAIRVVHRKNQDLSFRIEQKYTKHNPSNNELRRFIQVAGIKATRIAPWSLLVSTASRLVD